MATALREGDAAPDFELAADEGSAVRLSALRGSWVVLFFYPRALTPGCTTEACGFRDLRRELAQAGVEVLGLSHDPVDRLRSFKAKNGLNFPLLSDPDHATAQAYGVFGEKRFMGREFMGVHRTTFLIDADGTVARVWPRVRVHEHASEVLSEARRLLDERRLPA